MKCKVYIYVTEEGIIYVVADKNKEATDITPNDPYYLKQEEKKKKLLGIFGSSKKAEKPVFGLGMKFGTGTMGDGESYDSAKKEEPTAVDQWGLHAIGYLPKDDPNSAWNLVGNVDINKKNITIAVIDSGLDTTHPDGPTYIWTNKNEIPNNGIDDDHNGYVDDVHGWNFLEENTDLTDYKGHGTFVSGIIAAKANNGIGIAGINPGAEIMPLKVTNEEGEANAFHIARAVRYAADNGARIINLSIAGDGVSQILQLAFNYAERKGVFVVVASGNENLSTENYGPVANQHVTAVGATNIDGTRASISSWGPNNALLGPGEEIWSLRSKDSFNKRSTGKEYWEYYPQSGTSFSTPMAAATASLLLVKYPGLTAKQLEDVLLSTADEMYDPGWDDKSGAGMMNASAALNFDPEKIFNVKIDKVRINLNEKDKPETVDVFATVQGNIQAFHVELGKTFRAKKFKQVAGPFNVPANNAWIARIPIEEFKGNKEWLLRINATHKDGTIKYATTEVNLR